MQLSFKYKFILSFVAIEIFFISLILFFNFTSLNTLSKSLIEEKIQTGSKLFTELIKTPMLVSDLATLDDALKSLLSIKHVVGIKITDKQGRVISHLHSDNTIEEESFTKEPQQKISQIEVSGRTFRIVSLPILVEEEILGNAKIIFEITESLKTIQENKKFTLFLVLLEILFSIVIAYIIGHKLTNALSLLTASAHEVAQNDQTLFADVGTNDDEISVLSKALHSMQQKIAQRNSDMSILVEKLQESSNALEEEKDFYNSLLDNASSIFLVMNRRGEIVLSNKALEKLIGYTQEEILGRLPWEIFIPSEIRENVKNVFFSLVAGDFPSTYENVWVTKSGSLVPFGWSNSCTVDKNGAIEYVITVGMDLSERNKIDQTIRALLNSPLDSIILIDTEETILEINEVAANRFGYTIKELKGKKIFDYFSEEISFSRREHFIDVIFKKQPVFFEESYNDSTFKNHLYPILGGNGEVTQISIFSHDVTLHRKAQRELDRYIKLVEELSVTDQLTGLYNRRYFDTIFESELNRAKRDAKIFCFLSFDVDNFKMYNDTYGHQMGDEVLTTMGRMMKKNIQRAGDFAFRLGGEEFGAIYCVNEEEDIAAFANKLCNAIENEQIQHKQNSASAFVTASFGVVYVNFAKDDSIIANQRILYKKADDLLYEAKESGRNRAVVGEFVESFPHAKKILACGNES